MSNSMQNKCIHLLKYVAMHSNHDKLLKSKTQREIVTNISPEKHIICIIQALGLLCNFSQKCSNMLFIERILSNVQFYCIFTLSTPLCGNRLTWWQNIDSALKMKIKQSTNFMKPRDLNLIHFDIFTHIFLLLISIRRNCYRMKEFHLTFFEVDPNRISIL